jgi:hypothetical protein
LIGTFFYTARAWKDRNSASEETFNATWATSADQDSFSIDRLETKGLVKTWMGDAMPQRGRRRSQKRGTGATHQASSENGSRFVISHSSTIKLWMNGGHSRFFVIS